MAQAAGVDFHGLGSSTSASTSTATQALPSQPARKKQRKAATSAPNPSNTLSFDLMDEGIPEEAISISEATAARLGRVANAPANPASIGSPSVPPQPQQQPPPPPAGSSSNNEPAPPPKGNEQGGSRTVPQVTWAVAKDQGRRPYMEDRAYVRAAAPRADHSVVARTRAHAHLIGCQCLISDHSCSFALLGRWSMT
jgi:hypothetical protein